jgi:predicted Holliday junction resolvase-like endonuclease
MPFEDLLVIVHFTWFWFFAKGFFYIRVPDNVQMVHGLAQIIAIENRYRAELEKWKLESSHEIWIDSVNRSHSTLKRRITEQMAPVLPGFLFNPAYARFIGSPVDYIIFDGLTGFAMRRTKRTGFFSWM